MKFIRQGDVLIEVLDALPQQNLKKKKDTILLEGEASNHFHRLHGGVVFEERPTIDNNYLLGFFELDAATPLTHEEHETITFVPGFYKFYSQREYDEIEERRVID